MVRIGLGVVVGIVVAVAIMLAAEWLDGTIFTLPSLDEASPAQWIAAMPLGAKLGICLGWFVAPFGGGWIAQRIAARPAAGWGPALGMVALGIYNVTTVHHPLWMTAAAVVLPLLAGWLATRRRD